MQVKAMVTNLAMCCMVFLIMYALLLPCTKERIRLRMANLSGEWKIVARDRKIGV